MPELGGEKKKKKRRASYRASRNQEKKQDLPLPVLAGSDIDVTGKVEGTATRGTGSKERSSFYVSIAARNIVTQRQ